VSLGLERVGLLPARVLVGLNAHREERRGDNFAVLRVDMDAA
jgi:hypothetical protein